jgi:hypothetical protein
MSVAVHYENFMTVVFEPTARRFPMKTLMLVHHGDAFSWRFGLENRNLRRTPGTRTPRVTR